MRISCRCTSKVWYIDVLLAMIHGRTKYISYCYLLGAIRVSPVNFNYPSVHLHGFWNNYLDKYGNVPIYVVAAIGVYLPITALIAGGADLEVCDHFDSTPLHHASIVGYGA
jgi:hypothetical protein